MSDSKISQPFERRYATGAGHTAISFDQTGEHIIVGGLGGNIAVYKGYDDSDPTNIEAHEENINAIAVKGNSLVTCSDDHRADLRSLPDGELVKLCCRFTLSALCVAISTSGSHVASGGEDHEIQVVNINTDECTKLKGHEGIVRSLVYDPKGEYLVSTGGDGSLKVWDPTLYSNPCIKTISVLPTVSEATLESGRCQPDWSQDGEMLALPVGNDVHLFHRDTWQQMQALKGGHKQPISVIKYSPNGSLLASAGLDGQIVIWDPATRTIINRWKGNDGVIVTDIAWHPQTNTLAYADAEGGWALWEINAVIGARPSIGDDATVTMVTNDILDGIHPDDIQSDDDAVKADGRTKGAEEGKVKSAATETTKKEEIATKKTEFSTNQEGEDLDRDLSDFVVEEDHAVDVDEIKRKAAKLVMKKLISNRQEAFQPGSTEEGPGRRKYLAYNMIGLILTRDEMTYHTVDIEFHDLEGRRNIHFTDNYGFTLAALGDRAAVFANQSDKTLPSTGPTLILHAVSNQICVKHFEGWAGPTSDWTVPLPIGESALCVALGDRWVAVATDKNLLRIFSITGLQQSIHSLSGPVVALAGRENKLAVAMHRALAGADQDLLYILYDITEAMDVGRCIPLALSPGSKLEWMGFNDQGAGVTYDTAGVVRLLGPGCLNPWVPVADLRQPSNSDIHMWIVSLSATEICVIKCKGLEPAALPRPMITVLPLLMPACQLDNDLGRLEHALMIDRLRFSLESQMTEDENQRLAVQTDTSVLKLVQIALKQDKALRVLDLCSHLNLPKSFKIAIKLAERERMPKVAERINLILQAKEQEQEAKLSAEMEAVEAAVAEQQQQEEDRMNRIELRRERKRLQTEKEQIINVEDDESEEEDVEVHNHRVKRSKRPDQQQGKRQAKRNASGSDTDEAGSRDEPDGHVNHSAKKQKTPRQDRGEEADGSPTHHENGSGGPKINPFSKLKAPTPVQLGRATSFFDAVNQMTPHSPDPLEKKKLLGEAASITSEHRKQANSKKGVSGKQSNLGSFIKRDAKQQPKKEKQPTIPAKESEKEIKESTLTGDEPPSSSKKNKQMNGEKEVNATTKEDKVSLEQVDEVLSSSDEHEASPMKGNQKYSNGNAMPTNKDPTLARLSAFTYNKTEAKEIREETEDVIEDSNV